MRAISIWASYNTKKAILLIILFEILKISIGFGIGQHFLSTLSPVFIELAVLALVFLVTYVQHNYKHKAQTLNKEAHRKFRLHSTGIILLSSLCLSILLGNKFKGLGYTINSGLVANAAVSNAVDSVQTAPINDIKATKQAKKQKSRLFAKKYANDNPTTNKRIGYVLLFLLSLVLTYYGLYLSCGILCSGYGLLAALSLLLTLGVLSGGIYFLIKAFSNPLKPNSLMNPQEKKKERKKFFSIWAFISAAAALLIIITTI